MQLIKKMARLISCLGPLSAIALLVVSTVLAGCAAAPGMRVGNMTDRASSTNGDETPPDGTTLYSIDARLIQTIEQEKSQQLSNRQISPVRQLEIDSYEYRVGPSDILTIIVWDHPELTIPAGSERNAIQAGTVVANDGTIYYPYVGVVKVAGKTLVELRELLTNKLGDYIEDLKLEVRVAAFRSKRVYVVGEVKEPGVRRITDIPPTILEMINLSGGFTTEADRRNVTLTRTGETRRIDLLALYEEGDSSQNILLRQGDVINVWDRELNKIFVLGEVNIPGSYMMNKHRKSLAEALSDAGGVNADTSNPGQVFVVRGSREQPEVFHLDASAPDALILADRFPLLARDVVYVDTASIVRWNKVITNVSATVGILESAAQIRYLNTRD